MLCVFSCNTTTTPQSSKLLIQKKMAGNNMTSVRLIPADFKVTKQLPKYNTTGDKIWKEVESGDPYLLLRLCNVVASSGKYAGQICGRITNHSSGYCADVISHWRKAIDNNDQQNPPCWINEQIDNAHMTFVPTNSVIEKDLPRFYRYGDECIWTDITTGYPYIVLRLCKEIADSGRYRGQICGRITDHPSGYCSEVRSHKELLSCWNRTHNLNGDNDQESVQKIQKVESSVDNSSEGDL